MTTLVLSMYVIEHIIIIIFDNKACVHHKCIIIIHL